MLYEFENLRVSCYKRNDMLIRLSFNEDFIQTHLLNYLVSTLSSEPRIIIKWTINKFLFDFISLLQWVSK